MGPPRRPTHSCTAATNTKHGTLLEEDLVWLWFQDNLLLQQYVAGALWQSEKGWCLLKMEETRRGETSKVGTGIGGEDGEQNTFKKLEGN